MSETIYEVAPDGTPERLIQRLENATPGNLFYCEADREEAVEIAQEEFTTALATTAARARREALEEAAKVCDLRVSVWRHHIGKPSQTDMDEQVASLFENAAQAIRALVANTPETKP